MKKLLLTISFISFFLITPAHASHNYSMNVKNITKHYNMWLIRTDSSCMYDTGADKYQLKPGQNIKVALEDANPAFGTCLNAVKFVKWTVKMEPTALGMKSYEGGVGFYHYLQNKKWYTQLPIKPAYNITNGSSLFSEVSCSHQLCSTSGIPSGKYDNDLYITSFSEVDVSPCLFTEY
ncbi:TPA: hypothetical protein ACIBFG_002349 [Salmonella enterica subsp. enterica serovar Bahrenfeld]|nr:hypothetical protein [Salmonella enterica]HAR9008407.1 hypothetical protein [Salmonella enterica]HAR9317400.1 hypothetical protein [Salmonella enterica]